MSFELSLTRKSLSRWAQHSARIWRWLAITGLGLLITGCDKEEERDHPAGSDADIANHGNVGISSNKGRSRPKDPNELFETLYLGTKGELGAYDDQARLELESQIETIVRDSELALPSQKIEIIDKYLTGAAYERAIGTLFKNLSFADSLTGIALSTNIRVGPVRERSIHRLALRTEPTIENARKLGEALNQGDFLKSDYYAVQSGIDSRLRFSRRGVGGYAESDTIEFIKKLNQICDKWEFEY